VADDAYRGNAIVSNLVYAGIAASDAICCVALGEHSQGDSHGEAVALLKKVRPDGPDLAKSLAALLALKTDAAYGNQPLSRDKQRRAERSAEKLIQAAIDILV
jgi:hypothetical protein